MSDNEIIDKATYELLKPIYENGILLVKDYPRDSTKMYLYHDSTHRGYTTDHFEGITIIGIILTKRGNAAVENYDRMLKDSERKDETLAIAQEANTISKQANSLANKANTLSSDANTLSEKANKKSNSGLIVSICSAVGTVISAIVAIIALCQSCC